MPRIELMPAQPVHPGAHTPSTSDASCPWCGYNLAGLGESTCPECGSFFGPEEVAAAGARRALLARATTISLRFVAVPAIAGVLFGVLLALIGATAGAVVVAVGIGLALPFVAFVTAIPAVLLSRPWERPAVLLAWMRHAWWLWLAWLALPAIAALAGVVMLLTSAGESALLLILIVIAAPWTTVALTGVLAWSGAWHESDRQIKHHPQMRALAIFCGAALTLITGIAAALGTGVAIALPFLIGMSA